MRESKVENETKKYAKELGWQSYKFKSPSNNGVPDRIFMREGIIFFVEFKAPGKAPRKLQKSVISKFRKNGFDVYVVDTIIKGRLLLESYQID